MKAMNASHAASHQQLDHNADRIAQAVLSELHLPSSRDIATVAACTAGEEEVAGHIRAYAAAMWSDSPPLWIHHLAWAKSCMMHRGCDEAHVESLFMAMRAQIAKVTGSQECCLVFDLGLKTLPSLPSHVSCSLSGNMPFAQVAEAYLDRMLEGDKPAARDVLGGVELELDELYMHVIGPAMYRVGELWQAGKITPAQEHCCTAMTSDFMAELRQGKRPRGGQRIVAACLGGERHDVGLRMVADLFELRGWVSMYLGADVPVEDLVTVAADYEAELLAVSVSMTANLPQIRRLADAMDAERLDARLLIGGGPLQIAPAIHELLGADATAADAKSAVEAATGLLAH